MKAPFETDPGFSFPVLVGDIGGTNARFALLVDSYAEPKSFPNVATADHATIDAAIQSSVLDHTSVQPRTVILAVAGPVDGDAIELTNCDWVVRPNDLIANLGFEDVVVLNDFEAQALAVAFPAEEHREKLGEGGIEEQASRVVLGPGTGLGVAGLVNSRHVWVPVPGEGGHIDLGPRTPRDYALFPHIEAIEGRVSAEQVLCGRGLVNLYRAICMADGDDPTLSTPQEITAAALGDDDAKAVETVSLFATYLGRVAGDIALVFMARGGVYLSGGISQRILPALRRPAFRAAFEDKAPHTAAMRAIATYVVTQPLAALAGLAAYARTPSRFGVATEGRRWKR